MTGVALVLLSILLQVKDARARHHDRDEERDTTAQSEIIAATALAGSEEREMNVARRLQATRAVIVSPRLDVCSSMVMAGMRGVDPSHFLQLLEDYVRVHTEVCFVVGVNSLRSDIRDRLIFTNPFLLTFASSPFCFPGAMS